MTTATATATATETFTSTGVTITTKQDEIEEKFGITAFASKDVDGFAAILKARFSDFCVREGETSES